MGLFWRDMPPASAVRSISRHKVNRDCFGPVVVFIYAPMVVIVRLSGSGYSDIRLKIHIAIKTMMCRHRPSAHDVGGSVVLALVIVYRYSRRVLFYKNLFYSHNIPRRACRHCWRFRAYRLLVCSALMNNMRYIPRWNRPGFQRVLAVPVLIPYQTPEQIRSTDSILPRAACSRAHFLPHN